MSLKALAKSIDEGGGRDAHAAVSIVSPGKDERGEEKNQDRLTLAWITDGENTRCQLAVVCDGVTPSPYAAAAAEYVSAQVRELFQEGGLRRIAGALKVMRLSLLEKPPEMGEGRPPRAWGISEEAARQKYRNSYQTTFVAVCVKRDATNSAGMVSVKALGCGDSALFIFRENGELCYSNVNLNNEGERFRRGPSFIPVLPDCYDEEGGNVLFDFEEYPEDVHLLLCSDGLYEGFTDFKELRGWLNKHRAELTDSLLRDKCLSELHRNLGRTKADDDISFIWLYPNEARPASEEEAAGGGK